MNTKDKGNIGEAIVLAEFIKRQIQVSIPFGDNARYDLIADFNGKLNKIQIKYCSRVSENNSFVCQCSSSTNHTTNKCLSTYENDVDYIAFYLANYNKSLLVPIEDLKGKQTITFRNTIPKNNQTKGIHLIDNYLFDNTLCVETLHDKPKS